MVFLEMDNEDNRTVIIVDSKGWEGMALNVRVLEIQNLKQAEMELAKINCDTMNAISQSAVFRIVKLEQVSIREAILLKQIFLAEGGGVAMGKEIADLSEISPIDMLLCATLKQFQMAIIQLKAHTAEVFEIAEAIERVLKHCEAFPERSYHWKQHSLSIRPKRTLIMGILNVTPDSFSDGGRYNTIDKALYHVEDMIQSGADIIDIGAESTRPYPGARKVSAEEEMERLAPLLEKIVALSTVPVSIDTYKAKVALEALKIGVHIINDIWGLQQDRDMANVVAQFNVPVIIMHNQDTATYSNDIMSEIYSFLQDSIAIGLRAGIAPDKFIVDPGIGFGKTAAHNLMVMSRLDELRSLGCPILLGTSNKRFIGEILDLPVEDRMEGTGATVALGIMKGSNIIRVHDVQAMARIAKMTDAMMRSDSNE